VLGRWQGYVTEVGRERFRAIVKDEHSRRPDEEVDIDLREVPPADRDLIAPGAVFYWVIGYRDTAGGGRVNESRIRMQRLPAWTEEDLQEVRGRAAEMSLFLGHGDPTPATSK
jgi:hypothetical protein